MQYVNNITQGSFHYSPQANNTIEVNYDYDEGWPRRSRAWRRFTIRRSKESRVDPNYYLIINMFRFIRYVYKSDVAPWSIQRILIISSCGHAFYTCLLPRCDRLPVSPGQRVYITCHVVYRVHWITRMLRHVPLDSESSFGAEGILNGRTVVTCEVQGWVA